jgi:hypothetical protein
MAFAFTAIGLNITPLAYGRATTIQFRSIVDGQVGNFCGNIAEDVRISGTVNTVIHATQDANIIYGHTNFQGVSGVGLTTGNKYIFAGGVNPISNIREDSANVFTFLAHGRLISQGQQQNQLATTQFHLTDFS